MSLADIRIIQDDHSGSSWKDKRDHRRLALRGVRTLADADQYSSDRFPVIVADVPFECHRHSRLIRGVELQN